ncbi:MAG: ABC transporter substrate binding protein [Burkholderiaceae bacterium]
MRSAARALLLVGLLLAPVAALADSIAVLLSGQGGGYAEVVEAIQTEVRKSPGHRVVTATVGTAPSDEFAQAAPTLLVAVGTRAAEAALRAADPRVPVLCVLLPRSSYETLLAATRSAPGRPGEARADETRASGDPRKVSAVFLDQPHARQIELIRQALPGLARVGLVAGPDSAREIERVQAAAERRGLKVVAERVSRDTELFQALQRVMTDSDVFLALPDPRVVTSESAQNLLITSYRLRSPVIGYSAAYVRAGALAAVYSTPAQIGTQAGEIARAVLRGAPLPAPQAPRAFAVAVNRQVARSLGIEIDDDTALRERIARQERDER